ncbi:MAG: hypothetical protein ACE5I5_16765, partial [Candidatus Heimdallarchaeota archaeon]
MNITAQFVAIRFVRTNKPLEGSYVNTAKCVLFYRNSFFVYIYLKMAGRLPAKQYFVKLSHHLRELSAPAQKS